MTTELTMLALSAGLLIVNNLSTALPVLIYQGIVFGFGNRGDFPNEPPAWAGRAERAQRNTIENVIPFAVLVLVAHAAGVSNEATVLGATMFFYARVAHTVIYIAGIPYLRTVAFVVGFSGMLGIARQIFAA